MNYSAVIKKHVTSNAQHLNNRNSEIGFFFGWSAICCKSTAICFYFINSFFINHATKKTQWIDPRSQQQQTHGYPGIGIQQPQQQQYQQAFQPQPVHQPTAASAARSMELREITPTSSNTGSSYQTTALQEVKLPII